MPRFRWASAKHGGTELNQSHILSVLLATLLLLTSCGHSSYAKKATVFTGGALAGFGGANGGEAATRQLARDVMDLRTFDLISNSFTLSNGAVTSQALGGGSFGAGQGTQILGVERAAVLLSITSSDPDVSDVVLSGDYDINQGQQAIDVPGASFSAGWRLSFTQNGVAKVITFVQELTGAQFVTVP